MKTYSVMNIKTGLWCGMWDTNSTKEALQLSAQYLGFFNLREFKRRFPTHKLVAKEVK